MSDTGTQTPPQEQGTDVDGTPMPPPATPPAPAPEGNGAPAPGAPTGGTAVSPGGKPGAESEGGAEGEANVPEDKRTVQQIAEDYIIPLSESAEKEWEQEPSGFLQHAVEVAKGLYPTLASQLSTGITTQTLVDPYEQVAKQMLGPQTHVDWSDPKWGKALDGGRTKDGAPALMPLSEWRTLLRTDPTYGYDKTPQSHAAADGLADAIHKSFSGNA